MPVRHRILQEEMLSWMCNLQRIMPKSINGLAVKSLFNTSIFKKLRQEGGQQRILHFRRSKSETQCPYEGFGNRIGTLSDLDQSN
jgi:hypothetical protein